MPQASNPSDGGFAAGYGAGLRRAAKSAGAFRTISEVAGELDVPQHVLRFWETRFTQIRPLKRAGGRRYYRPEDVDLLRRIRELLYKHGYTIKGVQKLLRDGARADDGASSTVQPVVEEHEPMMPIGHARPAVAEPIAPPRPSASGAGRIDRASIESAINELEGLRQLLRARRR